MPIVRRRVVPRWKRILKRTALAASLLAILSSAWMAWSVVQVVKDLRESRVHAERLGAAIVAGQYEGLSREGDELYASARRAADRSDSWWWAAAAHLPVVGDDLGAVAAVSASIDEASSRAIVPLLRTVRVTDRVARGGRIDVERLIGLRPQVREGVDALGAAAGDVADLDPDDYVSAIGEAVLSWRRAVGEVLRTARDAEAGIDIAPRVLGSEEPARFLLVFETNAEVRATGGLPGSWSLVEADRGRLRILRQGSGGLIDGPSGGSSVAPTSSQEQAVWGPQLGLYFRDANMTSDFPRAAELMRQHWAAFGGRPIDGVIGVDVVSLGYLLRGLGPVAVEGVSISDSNVRQILLNGIYEKLSPSDQDDVFALFAREVVDRLLGDEIDSAPDVVLGLGRAIVEDRLHVAWFDASARRLSGTRLEGAFVSTASRTPVVDVTLNDATGSKMSYFLRYDADVQATGCRAGRQSLEGHLDVVQTVAPEVAAQFADYVTGAGFYGVPPGNQVVLARVFGPVGGSIDSVRVNDEPLDLTLAGLRSFEGRPVVTLALQPDDQVPSSVSWTMTTGEDQPGDVQFRITPGVLPGTSAGTRSSACP